MDLKELEEERQKFKQKNISFEEQCKNTIKFISENKVKTIKRSNNSNAQITKRK